MNKIKIGATEYNLEFVNIPGEKNVSEIDLVTNTISITSEYTFYTN